ncbi:unnamed protein product [Prunus armeniaca]|uniref:Maf-like protein n=1 Tax=Prunus armeniaca TaxID=36596 RepID=A0A6J5VP47_PRUAR|nr:unnamed protein product [Prunus armeniaca]
MEVKETDLGKEVKAPMLPCDINSFQNAKRRLTASQCFAVLSDNLIKQKVTAETKMSFQIILGSASMARRKILAEMGYEFTILTADIDEKSIRMDKPEELVMVLAEAKADAIISRLQSTSQPDEDAHATLLITADTVVVYEGIIREKPSSKEEAWNFIKGYFHIIPEEIIDSLIEEGITLDVAGGLMLEHPLISPFVEAVVGTTDTVMGLPKELTEKLIHEALQLL